MYNIAVLVYNLINNYNHTVVDGIVSFFEGKTDVRLFVAPVNIPHAESDNFDYQYWSSVKVLENKSVDGIILIPNSFTNLINWDVFSKELKGFTGKPVVSVSRPVDLPGSKYTYNSSESAYDQIIEHLKNKHNCKRIAFFGAGLAESPESIDRFESFQKALAKHNLKFYPDLVFEGDFTPGTAENVLSHHIKSKEDVNFDAICCVNDFTSGGCLFLFEKLGIKCPQDVILVGYDDSDFAQKTSPSMTSINQEISLNAKSAAEMLYKTLNHEETVTALKTDSFPVYRQSCGCINRFDYSTAFYDCKGNYFGKDEAKEKTEFRSVKKQQQTLLQIYNMVNLIDNKINLETISDVLKMALKIASISSLTACFYDEPVSIYKDDDITLPETIRCQVFMDFEKEGSRFFEFGKGPEIKIGKELFSESCMKYSAGLYFLYPIFLRDTNYGYMLCKSNNQDYLASAIHLKILSDILVNAYEGSIALEVQKKLIEKNVNLSLSIKTDELTKLFNRRGFLDYGQRLIEVSIPTDKSGAIFFCDLDNLKKINDTWGHEMGDLAIKTEAEVLRTAFLDSDLIGRLSGDEFAIVAPGFNLNCLDDFKKRLQEINEKFSREKELPFTLSISVGGITYNAENSELTSLLVQADQQLYEEKKLKHPEREYPLR